MRESIQTAIDVKPAIGATIFGGAVTFTAANVISLIGLCVGVGGLVVALLQWLENRRRREEMARANDIARERLDWDKQQKEESAK